MTICTPRLILCTSTAAVAALTLATLTAMVPSSARADTAPIAMPAGTLVDNSYDPSDVVQVAVAGQEPRVPCPDRNFLALGYVWSNSVNGCSVIGTGNGVKVGYAWRTDGSGGALINGRGYNSQRKTTWYAIPGNGGGTKQLPWGNVAASKMIQGISINGVATKIKFS